MRDNTTHDEPPFPDQEDTSGAVDNVTQIQPHSLEAEQIVIGTALQYPDAYTHLAARLAPRDFYRPAHEIMWASIEQLATDGKPIEATALLAHLRDTKQLTKVGAGPYIHTCLATATSLASAEYYAREVNELSRRRTAIHTLQSSLQRLRNPGQLNPGETLRDVADTLAEAADVNADETPTSTWSPVDLDAVLAGNSLDPPPELLERSDGVKLFYTGGVHTISGEPESGKTWVTLVAAVQLLDVGMDVVFIDFEDRADRVVGRLTALGATHEQIRRHFRYVRPDRPINSVSQHELAPHFEHAMLVIIDGVTEAMTVHGFDINSNEDAAKFFAILPRWIADHGPAVCMIDHLPKDKEKQGRHAIGAQHKLAGIDSAAYTVKVITAFGRGKKGLARIDVAKDRPGFVREHAIGNHIAEFTLDSTHENETIATLDPPTDTHLPGEDTWAPTVLMERISKYIYGNPGSNTNTIREAISGKDTAKRQALDTLVRRGHIAVERGPRNAKYYHHVSPFPPEEEDQP